MTCSFSSRIISLMILLVVSQYANLNCSPQNMKDTAFEIKLIDQDYSLAFSRIYCVNQDSIWIKTMGGIIGDTEKTIWKEPMNDSLKNKWLQLINSLALDSLQAEYTNPLIADGDQKLIFIKVSNNSKRIQISNTFVDFVNNIVELFNGSVPQEYFINYLKNSK